MSPGIIAQMNEAFQRFEDYSRNAGNPTVSDVVAHYFGLWPMPEMHSSVTRYEIMGVGR